MKYSVRLKVYFNLPHEKADAIADVMYAAGEGVVHPVYDMSAYYEWSDDDTYSTCIEWFFTYDSEEPIFKVLARSVEFITNGYEYLGVKDCHFSKVKIREQ